MMREQGIEANDSLHASVIELLHKTSPLEEVSAYVSSLERQGEPLGVKAQGALVAALAASGDTAGALRVYRKARREGTTPFPYAIGAILFRLGQEGRVLEMVDLFLDNMDPGRWAGPPAGQGPAEHLRVRSHLHHLLPAAQGLRPRRSRLQAPAGRQDLRRAPPPRLHPGPRVARGPLSMVRTLSPRTGCT